MLQVAPLFTMPLAGFFCTSEYGWKAIYYLQGALTLICFTVFYFIYRDQPRFHQNVSDKEIAVIERKKSVVTSSTPPPIPYREMFKDKFVIGSLVAFVGDFLCFNIFVLFAPVYLNKVLGMDITETGIISAIPYLGSFVIKMTMGPISDSLTIISTLTNVKVFMCVSQVIYLVILFEYIFILSLVLHIPLKVLILIIPAGYDCIIDHHGPDPHRMGVICSNNLYNSNHVFFR